jgi:hypothetical protein
LHLPTTADSAADTVSADPGDTRDPDTAINSVSGCSEPVGGATDTVSADPGDTRDPDTAINSVSGCSEPVGGAADTVSADPGDTGSSRFPGTVLPAGLGGLS